MAGTQVAFNSKLGVVRFRCQLHSFDYEFFLVTLSHGSPSVNDPLPHTTWLFSVSTILR
jgi:hypothetical protein